MIDHGKTAKDLWNETTGDLLSSDPVDAIFHRLSELYVNLDPDPLELGPKRIQEKIYECRKALSICEQIALSVSQKLHRAKRENRANKAALELSTKYLFSTDPEVRSGRNVSDRNAMAAVKLKEEWMKVHLSEQSQEDMEAIMLVVKAKRSDLRDTQSRLRDQMRLCQTEIELGGKWGSKVPNAQEIVSGGKVTDLDQLESLMANVEDRWEKGAPTEAADLQNLIGEKSNLDKGPDSDEILDRKGENQDCYLNDIPEIDLHKEEDDHRFMDNFFE